MSTEEQCSYILKRITSLLEAIYNCPSALQNDVSSFADRSSYYNYSKMSSDDRRKLVMSYGPGFPPFYKVYKTIVDKDFMSQSYKKKSEESVIETAVSEDHCKQTHIPDPKHNNSIETLTTAVLRDDNPPITITKPLLQTTETSDFTAIHMDTLDELGIDIGASDDIDYTMEFSDEELVIELPDETEPEPQNTVEVDQCPPVVSSSCSIKLAEFAVDPSLYTSNQVMKKSYEETWHTTFTEEVSSSQNLDYSKQEAQITLNDTNVKSNNQNFVLQTKDTCHKIVSFDNVGFELCFLKTLNAFCNISKQVQQVTGFHELSGTFQFKLFIHMTQVSNFPRDPDEWKNVRVHFLPNPRQPTHCQLTFPKAGQSKCEKVQVFLPSMPDNLMSLIWKKSSFVLSSGRMENLNNAFLNSYKVPLFIPKRNEFPSSNPTPILLSMRHKTREKIKTNVRRRGVFVAYCDWASYQVGQDRPLSTPTPSRWLSTTNKTNLIKIKQKLFFKNKNQNGIFVEQELDEYIANHFKQLVLGDKEDSPIIPGKESSEYENMVEVYMSKFLNCVSNNLIYPCNTYIPILQDLLPLNKYKPKYKSSKNSTNDKINKDVQNNRLHSEEIEDTDEVQILSIKPNNLGNKSYNKPVLGTEPHEDVPSTFTITRDHPPHPIISEVRIDSGDISHKILQNKIGFLFCFGCDTDFENGNLATIYQHPLKHMSESNVVMGCKSCKMHFSNMNILQQQQAILSHITSGFHWTNVRKYGNTELNPKQYMDCFSTYCQICDCQTNQNNSSQHFSTKTHLEHLKILDFYLSFCNHHNMKPGAGSMNGKHETVTNKDMKLLILFLDKISSKNDYSQEFAKNVVIRIRALQPRNVEILTQSIAALHNISKNFIGNNISLETTLPYPMLDSEINRKVTTCLLCGDNLHYATNLLCHMTKYHHETYKPFIVNCCTVNKLECHNVGLAVQTKVESIDSSQFKVKCQSEFNNYFLFCVHNDIHTMKKGFIEQCAGCNKKSTSIYEYYTQDNCMRYVYGYEDRDIQYVAANIAQLFGKNLVNTTNTKKTKAIPGTKQHFKKGECSSSSSTSTKTNNRNQHTSNPIQPKKHKCRLCGMAFTTDFSLKRHIANCVTTWSGPEQKEEQFDNEEQMACDDTISFEGDQEMAYDDTISFSDAILTPNGDGMEPMQLEAIGIENVDIDTATINDGLAHSDPVQAIEDKNNETSEVESEIQSQSDHLDIKYHYLCLDCEHEQGYDCGEACRHLIHPRFPITMDIAGHLIKTGHSNFEPIKNSYSRCFVKVPNLSYSSSLGGKVRKKWKKLIMSEMLVEHKYGEMRRCLKCEESFDNSLAMFSHIKKVH